MTERLEKTFGCLAAALCFAAWSFAQQAPPPGPAPGNALERLVLRNYTEPAVASYAARDEESLDAMIRDGRLALRAEDAVRLALENNVDINVERFNPTFSLWGVERGKAVLNPTLQYGTSINRSVTPATSALAGGDTLLNLTSSNDLAYRKPFEVGLDLDVTYSARRFRTSNFFSSPNPSITSTLGFQLTQHLLRDAGRDVRGRFLRIARNSYAISEQAFAARVSEAVTGVLNAYWDLVYNEEEIKVKESSKKLAEMVLEQNRKKAEVGTMAPLDVVQAEAEVAARNEALVVARYNRRITEEQLKKLISSRIDAAGIPAVIDAVSPSDPPPPPATGAAQAVQRALEARPEIKQLLSEQENKRIQVQFARNQLRPTLDLVASYSQNGLGGVRILRDYSKGIFGAPVIGFEPGGFWGSMDSLFSRRYLSYVVGLNLRVPLGNDDARATSAQAQIDLRQTAERLRSLQQRVALEVRQAYESIEMNRARVETAGVTVRYQEKRLQGEQDKYALGATTTRFILEAQRDLQDARSRLLKAKIDLIKSRISLDRTLGETLEANKIELKKALEPLR